MFAVLPRTVRQMPSRTGPVPKFAAVITARIWRLFLVSLLALLLFTGLLLWDLQRVAVVRATMPQTETIERNLRLLGEDLLDGETAQRGYLLTQEEKYLQPYQSAAANAHGRQQLLRRLMSDPTAALMLDRIDAVVNGRLDEIDSTVTLARSGARAAAIRVVLDGHGKRLMDEFRALRAEAIGLELRQLVERRAQVNSIFAQLQWTLISGALATIGLLFAYTRRTTRTLGKPIRNLLQAIQAVASGELDQRLAISTADEIGEIATALNSMTDRLVDARAAKDKALLELQRANEALRESNEIFRIMEQALRAARDAAESASRAKSDFLANMSHEIRTPLNGVIGMTGLLLESSLNSDQREFAEIARSSGESLLALINNILDFSKIESGSLELESIDFDLRALIDETVDGIALEAAKKHLEVLVDVDAGCPRYVRGDPTRLRQILLNLLSNAVKFTHTGDVTVTVGPAAAAAGRLGVALSVRDSGIGIPEDRVSRLFTPFTQADASTTRRHGGTGLGLSICRRLITAMGGQISVDSVAGRGTTFHFWILLDRGAQTGTAHKLRLIGPIRVLLVEDHAVSRRILSARLEDWGIAVQTAGNAGEALQRWDGMASAGETADLAIIDHQLPDQDAEWLAWQLRSRDRDGRCKLVLLSSLTSRFRNRDRGPFDRTLAKPVKGDALFRLLSELTAGQLAPPTIEAREAAPFVGLRALLVDDNPVNQKLGERLLARIGFQVTQAWNGRQALEHLRVQQFDVVLMDCQMPDMDGYETTRMLRQVGSGVLDCTVPVIAMTANALPGDRNRCLAAGMNDYLAKPINSTQLRAALHAVLASAAAAVLSQSERGASDDLCVLDTAALHQLFAGEPEFVDELLQTFSDSALALVADIQATAARHDQDGVTRLAHQLKGAAASAHAGALASAAGALELADDEQRAARLEMLTLAWVEVQAQLRSVHDSKRTVVLQ